MSAQSPEFLLDVFGELARQLPRYLWYMRLRDREVFEREAVADTLASLAMEHPETAIQKLFPICDGLATLTISCPSLNKDSEAQVKSLLSQAGVVTWGQLGAFSSSDLARRGGFAEDTVHTLVRELIDCIAVAEPSAHLKAQPASVGATNGNPTRPVTAAAGPSSDCKGWATDASLEWSAKPATGEGSRRSEAAAGARGRSRMSDAGGGSGHLTVADLFPRLTGTIPHWLAAAFPNELSEEQRNHAIDQLARRCLQQPRQRMEDLAPGLRARGKDLIEWTDLPELGAEELTFRTRQMLQACEIEDWADLGKMSPEALEAARYADDRTIRELIRAAVAVALTARSLSVVSTEDAIADEVIDPDDAGDTAENVSSSEGGTPISSDEPFDDAIQGDFVAALRVVATWVRQEGRGETFADMWRASANRLQVPEEVSAARAIMAQTSIEALLGPRASDAVAVTIASDAEDEASDALERTPIDALRQLLAALTPMQRMAIRESVTPEPGMSRSSLAVALQVSTAGLDDTIARATDAAVELLEQDEFADLDRRLNRLADRVGAWAPLDDPDMVSELDDIVAPGVPEGPMLRNLVTVLAGYISPEEAYETDEIDGVGSTLEALADEYMVLSRREAEAGVAEHGVHARHCDALLEWLNCFAVFDERIAVLGTDFVPNAIAVLAASGRPMAVDEILRFTRDDVDPGDLEMELFDSDRVIQVSRGVFKIRGR